MHRLIIILTLILLNFPTLLAQRNSNTISYEKVFGGYQFYIDNKRLNINQLVKTIKPNEQAYKQIKSAQTTYVFMSIINGAGGFLVGWQLGTALSGVSPNWKMAGIGAALITVSIPISYSYSKKAKLAVDIYNNGLQSAFLKHKGELKLSMTQNGIGFTFCF